MTGAQLATIGSFCRTGSGTTPPRSAGEKYYGGPIPWVKSGELREKDIENTEETVTELALKETPLKLIPAGSLLLAMYGATVGRTAILRTEATTNQAICHIIPDKSVADAKYLFHVLQHMQPTLVRRGVGGAQPNISQEIIRSIEVPLPPLNKQRRIVTILDQADDLRRRRADALQKADELSRAIYSEKFGDPVANQFGYPKPTIGALAVEMEYGPRFYNEAYTEDGTRIVRITDLSETGDLDFDAMPRLAVSEDDLTKHIAKPGELLFARTGATVGKLALISNDDPICIPGAYFIRLRFPKEVDPTFAWYTLRSNSIQAIIFEGSRQSAQQNFSGPGLRRLPFIVPPLREQQDFAAQVTEINKLRRQYREHLGKLDTLFATLQHRAFRGGL